MLPQIHWISLPCRENFQYHDARPHTKSYNNKLKQMHFDVLYFVLQCTPRPVCKVAVWVLYKICNMKKIFYTEGSIISQTLGLRGHQPQRSSGKHLMEQELWQIIFSNIFNVLYSKYNQLKYLQIAVCERSFFQKMFFRNFKI